MKTKPGVRFPRAAAMQFLVVGAAVAISACASGSTGEAAAPGPAEAVSSPAPAPSRPEPSPPPQPSPQPPQPPPQPAPAAAEGVFTDAQATRGRGTFDQQCADCHTNSEFRGGAFQRNWGRRTVYSFYRTVRSTMPDDNPGGLDEQVYLDVVSYILRMNGHAPGPSELAADSPMRDVRIGSAQPGGS